jgi:glycosyltransferase involved in cell wall biosynthesis
VTADRLRPIVYGDPGRVVNLFDSLVPIVQGQPDEVMAQREVRRSGHELTALIERRLAEAEASQRPELSVIVPAFNEERFIVETLDGLVASARRLSMQGVANELIVVDDQSTDGTAAFARPRADRVVAGPGTTIGAARNAGAAVARGQVLVFVDADTQVEAGTLPAIHAAAADGALAGSIRATYRSSRPLVQLLLRFWDWYAPRHYITQGVCQFFDRAAFEAMGGYRTDLRMAEDTDLHHRVQRRFGRDSVRQVTGTAVYPSMRRYEQVSVARLWLQMNPITTRWFRQSARLWRSWYVDPPR